jgi:hypothetical protein
MIRRMRVTGKERDFANARGEEVDELLFTLLD